MKKLLLGLAVCATSLIGVTGCQKEDKTLNIQLVPSFTVNSTALANVAKIQSELAKEMPGYTLNVSIGTSYTAVVEAMAAGTCDVGFLTSQQFAYAAVEMPGKIDVLLSSVRTAYQVQVDFPNNPAAQIAAMNGANGYNYLGQQATTMVNYYNSILITKSDSGINTLADLKGKKVGVQNTTSGSGYIYPAVTMSDAGLTFITTGTPVVAQNQVLLQTLTGGHPAAVTEVLNGNVDAAWTFLDCRYANFYSKAGNAYEGDATLFTTTKVVAMSTAMYNDTVSVRASMKQATRELLAAAFKKLPTTADGLAGISVYSHTGYQDATSADYDGEKQVYIYKRDVLHL